MGAMTLEREIGDVAPDVRIGVMAGAPVPVLVVGHPWSVAERPQRLGTALAVVEERILQGKLAYIATRCVGLDRLTAVLNTGIDVEPPTYPIFVDRAGGTKSLEYGGNDCLILALDLERLRSTSLHLLPPVDAARLDAARRDYKTVVNLEDGSIWCSMLDANDRRLASPYESEYARWIPGDPWQALLGIVVIGQNFESLLNAVESASCVG